MPPKKRYARISALDFVSSLVRSPLYTHDFEIFRNRMENGAEPALPSGSPPEQAEQAFLARWPLLLRPIPPAEARRNPTGYIGHIVPPVVLDMDTPKSWDDWRTHDRLPWPHARYHPVWINFFRNDEEIIDEIKNIRRRFGVLPIRESMQRAPGMPDRWKIWDTYQGRGRQNITRTAGILFPAEFDKRTTKAEVRDFAQKELERLRQDIDARERQGETHIEVEGKRLKLSVYLSFHENRITRMAATPQRQRKRGKRVAFVTRHIEFCRSLIDIHKPLERDSPLTSTLVGRPPTDT